MRTIRCHVDQPLIEDTVLTLPADVSNHLLRVLRLRLGDCFVLFNGDGHDYAAELLAADKHTASARIGTRQPVGGESPLTTLLGQGIARGEKMDLILQKAVELGVTHVQPLWTERTEVRLDRERLTKRMAHWRGVIVSACEQSGRAQVPSLAEPVDLAVFAQSVAASDALPLYLDPVAELSIGTLPSPTPGGIAFAIGPEGGFSAAERTRLDAAGFKGLRLGPRVLRTETAGLTALATLQARFGDLD